MWACWRTYSSKCFFASAWALIVRSGMPSPRGVRETSAVRKGMKRRKRTQAAFAHPDSSWSRKRSERIVIRIQIQMTKKKISNATRRISPKLMSARSMSFLSDYETGYAKVRAPEVFRMLARAPARGIRSQPHEEEDDRDRGGEVEAGDPLPHRNRDARLGPLEDAAAEAVTLGAEGEDRARRHQAGRQLLPRWIDCQKRPVALRQRLDL